MTLTSDSFPADIFTKDIDEDAAKLLKGLLSSAATANGIVIASEDHTPSMLFNRLQSHICAIVEHSPLLGDAGQTNASLLDDLRNCLTVHQLPDNMKRVVALMSVQLVLVCVANRSDIVDDRMLKSAVQMWRCAELQQFAAVPVPQIEDLDEAAKITGGSGEVLPAAARAKCPTPYMFANVVSVETMRNIYAASWQLRANKLQREQQQQLGLQALERLLRALLADGLLSVDELNEQTVRLLRWSWPDEQFLSAMAAMLRRLSEDRLMRQAPGEAQMFFGMMADLTEDLEFL